MSFFMCGINGLFHWNNKQVVSQPILEKMTETLAHRGPDDRGFYANNNIGLGHTRLSIIDLEGGKQPIFNEDRSICVVFNGEIFNYIELRKFLKKKGHNFYTKSDTEVIVHAYEEYGSDFLQQLNGQFAIALWDSKKGQLLLARDRVGIRPLYYSNQPDGTFLFASEIKAILTYPGIQATLDPDGLNQIFTLWVNFPPRTVFKNIQELPPGNFLSRIIRINSMIQSYLMNLMPICIRTWKNGILLPGRNTWKCVCLWRVIYYPLREIG